MKTAQIDASDTKEAIAFLSDTAKAVRVMKESWLRVALRLKHIREHELWRMARPTCHNYEEYVHGVLQINKAVHRRMLQAMEFAGERRPEFLEAFESGEREVNVPSYDVLNQLRRASPSMHRQD